MTDTPAASHTSRRPAGTRSRDAQGRPRNDRPRDGLGRPLPPGSAGEERVPDDLVLPVAEALTEAQRLLDSGRPFHAHEVLEGVWKSAPPDERDLWQGLAQLAVGVTHLQRGNPRGAQTLLERGRRRIARYLPGTPHGVDIAGVLEEVDEALAGRRPDGPRLRLRTLRGMQTSVTNDTGQSRYTIDVDGERAGFVTYVQDGDVVDLQHTEVQPEFEGQGIAAELVKGALDDIRARGLGLRATCSYVARYLQRNPGYGDLVR